MGKFFLSPLEQNKEKHIPDMLRVVKDLSLLSPSFLTPANTHQYRPSSASTVPFPLALGELVGRKAHHPLFPFFFFPLVVAGTSTTSFGLWASILASGGRNQRLGPSFSSFRRPQLFKILGQCAGFSLALICRP